MLASSSRAPQAVIAWCTLHAEGVGWIAGAALLAASIAHNMWGRRPWVPLSVWPTTAAAAFVDCTQCVESTYLCHATFILVQSTASRAGPRPVFVHQAAAAAQPEKGFVLFMWGRGQLQVGIIATMMLASRCHLTRCHACCFQNGVVQLSTLVNF